MRVAHLHVNHSIQNLARSLSLIFSGIDPKHYEEQLKSSWVYQELKSVRNVKPAIKKGGLYGGMMYTGVFGIALRGMEPWTFSHGHTDNESLKPAAEFQPASGFKLNSSEICH